MKRVLLDENFPQPFRLALSQFNIVTVGFAGWSGIQDGELVALAEKNFDVLLTGDKSLRYQQNLNKRTLSILEVPFTRMDDLLTILPAIKDAIGASEPGIYLQPVKD